MVATGTLTLNVPMPNAWKDSANGKAKVTLSLGNGVLAQSIGGVLTSTGLVPDSIQRRIESKDPLKVTIEISKDDGPGQTAKDLDAELVGAIDVAGLDDDIRLLRGSIRIALKGALKEPLKPLWPFPNASIEAIQLHPSGLYLEGILPPAFNALEQPDAKVVLRVPQQVKRNGQELMLWSLENYPFWDGVVTANGFIADYAQAITEFAGPPGTNLIDNATYQPFEDAVVQFYQKDEAVVWEVPELHANLRVQLSGTRTGETAFYPQQMMGAVDGNKRIAAREGGDGQVVLFHTLAPELDNGVASYQLDGNRELSIPNQVELRPLNIPGAIAEKTVDEDTSEVFRSWLCTTTGWLAIESLLDKVQLKDEINSPGSMRGVLEISPFSDQAGEEDLYLGLSAFNRTAISLGFQFKELDNQIESARLTIKNPITTLITPQVWYALPPTVDASQGGEPIRPPDLEWLPSLTSWPPGVLDPGVRVDRLLDRATFISSNVVENVEPEPSRPKLKAILKDKRIEIKDAQRFLLWHLLPDVPLAQVYSQTLEMDNNDFLDDNRGLVPYESKSPESITLSFASNRLPAIVLPDDSLPTWNDLKASWKVPDALSGLRFYLPTLPGIEAKLATTNGPFEWTYRHAVPALDEAYAEATESREGGTAPTVDPLGPDFTRVKGAIAFDFVPPNGGDTESTASGWLHDQSPMQVKINAFDPKEPLLKVEFDASKLEPNKVTFSRTETNSGLNGKLKGIVFPGNGQTSDTYIRNGGQSLIRRQDLGSYRLLDGEGVALDEPIDQTTTITKGTVSAKLYTGSFTTAEEPEQKLALELFGISAGKLVDESLQAWMLHDGDGGWPKLGQWPLYPIELSVGPLVNRTLKVVMEGILLHRTTDELDDNSNAANTFREAGGQITLELNADLANERLEVISCKGQLDWRFAPTEGEFGIVRVKSKSPITDLAQLKEEIEVGLTFQHPLGLKAPLEVEGQWKLDHSGELLLSDDARLFQYSINFGPLAPDTEASADILPINKAVLTWQYPINRNQQDTEAFLTYSYETNPDTKSSWKIEFKQGGTRIAGPFDLSLCDAGPNGCLFDVTGVIEEGPAHAEGLLAIVKATGMIGVTFSPGLQEIEHLVAEILIDFESPNKTRLAGVLSLQELPQADVPQAGVPQAGAPQADKPPAMLSLQVTGHWVVDNRILFKQDDQPLLDHSIELYLHKAVVPVQAMLLGTMDENDHYVAGLARHRLTFRANGSTRTWVAAQMVRFTTLRRYLNDGSGDSQFVLDAGAVFWLKPMSDTWRPTFDNTPASIWTPTFELRLRRTQARQFGKGKYWAVRIPAAAGTMWKDDGNRPVINLVPADTPLVYDATGAQPPTTKPDKRVSNPNEVVYIVKKGDTLWDLGIRFSLPYMLIADENNLDNPRLILVGQRLVIPGWEIYRAVAGDSWFMIAGNDHERVNLILRANDKTLESPIFKGTKVYVPVPTNGQHALVAAPPKETLLKGRQPVLAYSQSGSHEEWLVESYLAGALQTDSQNAQTGEGTPAFDEEGTAKPMLPGASISPNDLLWLKEEPQSEQLFAATLVFQKIGTNQGLQRPALYEFPFDVGFSNERYQLPKPSPESKVRFPVDVQLAVYESNTLNVLGRESITVTLERADEQSPLPPLPPEEIVKEVVDKAVLAWARAFLNLRRRFGPAFVLVNYERMLWVPAPFEGLYQQIPRGNGWDLNATGGPKPDARRRLPLGTNHNSNTSSTANRLRADHGLTVRVIDAYPAVPAVPADDSIPKPNTPAAVRFRLAPKATRDIAHKGQLAPAMNANHYPGTESTDPGETKWYSLTHLDEVHFEISDHKEPYPKPVIRSAGNFALPTIHPKEWIGVDEADPNKAAPSEGSFLPPLVDVVSWAARPGEMMRSGWAVNHTALSGKAGEMQEAISSGRHPFRVGLRRPRAMAGDAESVWLEPLEELSLLAGRICQVSLNLKQVLEESVMPNDLEIVMTTNSKVFRSSATDPARLYHEGDSMAQGDLEDFSFFVFSPNLQQNQNGEEGERRLLYWTANEDGRPEIDPSSGALTDGGNVNVIINNLDAQEGWRLVNDRHFLDSPKKDGMVESWGDENNVYIKLAEITKDTADDLFRVEPIGLPLKIEFLPKKGQFSPPPLVAAVLARPTSDKWFVLAGYGRLKPEQFKRISPQPSSDASKLRWVRSAELRLLQRNTAEDYTYDVVVYGPGGELIRTEEQTP